MQILIAILGSRIGQIAAAGLVGALWAWWATSGACDRKIAQEAALRAAANARELSRQETAARELAEEATARLVEAQEVAAANERIVEELRKEEANVEQSRIRYQGRLVYISDHPCSVDADFRSRVRKLRP